MVNFPAWLDRELSAKNWTRADLSQVAKISQSALSLIYSGDRKPGPEVCNAIAQALRLPPDEVFRAAGLLPPKSETTELIDQITFITSDLPIDDQQEILEYAKLRRKIVDERGKYETKRTHAKPATSEQG
ncbi:XRE family transcriptional regulator [Gammaproteobacteria bacterium]